MYRNNSKPDANHAIKGQGSGSSNPVGIDVGLSGGSIAGVNIKNITISGFDSALSLFSCSGYTISNNTLSNNGCGMQLYGTSVSIISDNTANDNNILSVPITDIYLSGATGNTVSGNFAADNGTNIELVNNSNGTQARAVGSGNIFNKDLPLVEITGTVGHHPTLTTMAL